MSNLLKLDLYSELKNEDAPPFVGKNFLIAADGLGGSGSTVHEIDRRRHPKLAEDIRRAAFGDFEEDALEELGFYLDRLIKPMADETPDTSALWGSRIVIGRFLYAVRYMEDFADARRLSDPAAREKLSAFISKGLHNVVKAFDLKRGKYDNQLLLPTTLAAIHYEENDKSVGVDCIWAGDSRCYALGPLGLKLLTKDDEDSSGAITNLFYASDKKTVLHYRHFNFTKPCVLLAVSDGVFDPYEPHDYLGVEHVLQTAIAESDSLDGLKRSLLSTFNAIHADDATIALTGFGFKDYDEMKAKFATRCKEVVDTLKKWREMHSVLEVINQPEEDIAGYVITRTNDKYTSIAGTLIPMLVGKKRGDAVLKGEILDRVDALREKVGNDVRIGLRDKREQSFQTLCEEMQEDPVKAAQYLKKKWPESIKGGQRIKDSFAAVVEASSAIIALQKEEVELEEKIRLAQTEQKTSLAKKISEYVALYAGQVEVAKNAALASLPESPMKKERESWKKSLDLMQRWQMIEYTFLNDLPIGISVRNPSEKAKTDETKGKNVKKLSSVIRASDEVSLLKALIAYQSAEQETHAKLDEVSRKLEEEAEKYKKNIKGVLSFIEKNGDQPHVFFSTDCSKNRSLYVSFSEINRLIDLRMEDQIKNLFVTEREAMVKAIVSALAASPTRESVIDSNYNATRLSRFRTYYRYKKKASVDDVRQIERTLAKMKADHESLLKDGTD